MQTFHRRPKSLNQAIPWGWGRALGEASCLLLAGTQGWARCLSGIKCLLTYNLYSRVIPPKQNRRGGRTEYSHTADISPNISFPLKKENRSS